MRTLDITREHCPMTFVKTKLELSRLAPGEELEVFLTEGEPLQNVPRSSAEQGYTVVSLDPVKDGVHRLVLRK